MPSRCSQLNPCCAAGCCSRSAGSPPQLDPRQLSLDQIIQASVHVCSLIRSRVLTCAPPPAAASPLAGASRSYNDYFHAKTRSIAHALAGGEHIPRNLLLKILKNRNIEPDALALWVDVLARKDPVYALDRLGLLESTATEIPGSTSNATTPRRRAAANAGGESCPDWLYLALPGLVTNRSHVPYLASQILSDRFTRLAEQKRALFVARCVQHFLRVRHYVALRESVEWVAYAGPAGAAGALTKTESFEVVLAALASERLRSDRHDATPSVVLEPLVTLLLASYARRTGGSSSGNNSPLLTFAMYRSLLSTKLVPRDPEQALRLLARMTRDGLTPSRAMLHRVMRVCARNGRHDATMRILEQIRGEIRHAAGALRRGHTGAVRAPELTDRLDEAIEQVHSAVETPLHLRGWNGLDIDRELESFSPSMEEDFLSPGAEDPDDLPLEAVRVRNHAPPPSSLSMTAKPKEVDEADSTTPARAVQDKYSTILLTDRAQVLPYFYEILSHATSTSSTSSSRTCFPAPPAYFDRVSWIQFFHTVSLQPDVTADQLVAVLQAVARASSTPAAASTLTAYVPPIPTLRLHTIVLHALVRRDEPRAALHLWRFLEKRGWQPDATLLDAVVRAHLALDHDRPALRLLDHYAHRPGVNEPELRVALPPSVGPDATAPARPHSVALTAVPLNAILAYYSHKNRFGAAYSLYREMSARFAVEPDSATLSIMLDAARHASSRAGRGWTPASAFEEVSAAGPVFGGSMAAHRTGWSSDRLVDDTWDGEPASRVMERFVTHEVLEMNWQDAQIETPWEGRGVVGWLTRRFALREVVPFRGPGSRTASDVPADWYPFASTLSPTPPSQPHLYPTDRVFRSLIRLVGTHSSITTIPTLISWMRHLQITPSRFTLCIALAYVDGEASFRPEQMERWRIWMADWLGEDALPTQAEIAWMRRDGKREGKPVTRRI